MIQAVYMVNGRPVPVTVPVTLPANGANGTMNVVLNSPILASMPAAQMSTLNLFKAAKLGA